MLSNGAGAAPIPSSRPSRPAPPGRLTATYKRHGTTCLPAALAVHPGEVAGRCVETNDHTTFLRFFKSLYLPRQPAA